MIESRWEVVEQRWRVHYGTPYEYEDVSWQIRVVGGQVIVTAYDMAVLDHIVRLHNIDIEGNSNEGES